MPCNLLIEACSVSPTPNRLGGIGIGGEAPSLAALGDENVGANRSLALAGIAFKEKMHRPPQQYQTERRLSLVCAGGSDSCVQVIAAIPKQRDCAYFRTAATTFCSYRDPCNYASDDEHSVEYGT